MYIKNIFIDGFGKFVEQSFSFNRNINLIFGKNESGKTTLINFIFAMLFGFKDSNGEIVEQYYKFKPWNHKFYGGSLTFKLDGDSHEYIIKRDFLNGDISIYEGQKDITSSINYEPNGEISFIREKTGFSRDGALNLFKHTDINITKSGLKDYIIKLENFMEKENDTVLVKNALNSISESIKSIGSISDSISPLGKLSIEAKELENELNFLKKEYNEVWKLQEDCNNLNIEIDAFIAKKKRIMDDIKSFKVKETLLKLNQIKKIRADFDQLKSELTQIEKYKDVDSSEIISLERLEATHQELTKTLENLETKHSKTSKRFSDLEKSIEIYEQKFKIRDFSDIDKLYLKTKNINLAYGIIKERKRMLRDLEDDIDSLRQQSQTLLKDFNSLNSKLMLLGDLDEFNSKIDEFLNERNKLKALSSNDSYSIDARLLLTDKNISRFKFAFFVSVLTIFVGMLLGFFINPWLYLIGAGGLILMIVYLFEMIKSKSSINLLSKKMEELKKLETNQYNKLKVMENDIFKSLRVAGIRNIEEYKNMYEKYLSIKKMDNSKLVDEKLKELSKLQSSIDDALNDLKRDLAELNVSNLDDIEQSIAILNNEIEDYKNLSFEKSKLYEDLNRFKLEIGDIKEKLSHISNTIAEKLKTLGFDDISAYRMALEKKEKYFTLLTKSKDLEIELEKINAGKQVEMEEYIKSNAHLVNIEPKATEKQLKLQLQNLEEDINISKSKLSTMLLTLEKKQNNLKSIGKVKSALSYTNYKISKLIDEKNTLTKLYDIMHTFYNNVKKNFIPKLNKEVSKIFNGIVENPDYSLKVNDNLEVEVIYNKENITSNISTGTYHQLALSLKLALLSIMSSSDESLPILLDDAFSEYDTDRINPTVKFLKSISNKIQVIISSCRVDVLDISKQLKFKIINPR